MNQDSGYLSFSGRRVHFGVVRPEGEIKNRILMLSSPLINTFHWRKLVPELSELGCLCVPVDLPGFGLSDADAPQGDSLRANMVWGVLDEVEDQPMSMWHLMAHGSACSVILRMAAMYPDSVKTMIHVCPAFSLRTPGRDGDLGRWYDVHVASQTRFRSLVEHYCGYPLDDYILDRMRRPLLRPGARGAFARMLKYAAEPPRQGMGFCPTMALLGGRDPLNDELRQDQVHQLLGEAEIHTLRSAGHFPMETHSKAMRDYLRGWLRYND